MLHDISHDKPGDSGADAPATGQLARQQAIAQIERRRRFWISTTVGALAAVCKLAPAAQSTLMGAVAALAEPGPASTVAPAT